jgi:hypothetical protein
VRRCQRLRARDLLLLDEHVLGLIVLAQQPDDAARLDLRASVSAPAVQRPTGFFDEGVLRNRMRWNMSSGMVSISQLGVSHGRKIGSTRLRKGPLSRSCAPRLGGHVEALENGTTERSGAGMTEDSQHVHRSRLSGAPAEWRRFPRNAHEQLLCSFRTAVRQSG